MPGFSELGLGHKLEALRQRIATLERDMKSLRQDMSRALSLLEQIADSESEKRPGDGRATESRE